MITLRLFFGFISLITPGMLLAFQECSMVIFNDENMPIRIEDRNKFFGKNWLQLQPGQHAAIHQKVGVLKKKILKIFAKNLPEQEFLVYRKEGSAFILRYIVKQNFCLSEDNIFTMKDLKDWSSNKNIAKLLKTNQLTGKQEQFLNVTAVTSSSLKNNFLSRFFKDGV